VLDAIERQLEHEPLVPARNRKAMRANAVAPWVLRIGKLRVYYEAEDAPAPLVRIRAVGVKVRNRVWIGGVEYHL
jgi:hypothetical protein